MKHVICLTTGLTGILNASFEVLSRLEKAGYRVTCACPRGVGERVQQQGFEFWGLPPRQFETAPNLPPKVAQRGKLQRLKYKWQHRRERQQIAIESLRMSNFEQQIVDRQPDLWLVDVELHEYIFTLIAKKEPVLLLSQWFSLWRRKGLPPLLHATIPQANWRSKLSLWLAWERIEWQRGWMFFKQKMRSAATDRRSVLSAYAKKVGFPKKYIRDNYWPGPFTYGELPVLSMTALEMEFPHVPRPNLTYIGPCVFSNRKDIQVSEATQRQLAQFYQQKRAGKSLLYCSVSTFKKGDTNFLKQLIAAVASEKNWLLIIGLGGKLDPAALGDLSKNIAAFTYVPQLEILAQADLSINHGGIHTIHECIHFAVPMLVYSGKRSDQNGCAARVQYHGLGIMADKDQDGAADIQRKIKKVLTEKHFQKQIKKYKKIAEIYQKDMILEQQIEKYCS
ncbi:MAG: glycosyltransferase [Saprospiraceae bacterium]